MSKVMFDSYEEAFKFFDETIETENDDHEERINIAIRNAMSRGYIKDFLKHKIEEFEKIFNEYKQQEIVFTRLEIVLIDLLQLLRQKHPEDFE